MTANPGFGFRQGRTISPFATLPLHPISCSKFECTHAERATHVGQRFHDRINCDSTLLSSTRVRLIGKMESVSLDFVPTHPSGMGGIGHASVGSSFLIISCGQDGKLCIHKSDDLTDKITKSMQTEGVPCHCLAVNPDHNSFAVGDEGHFVKVWSNTSMQSRQ